MLLQLYCTSVGAELLTYDHDANRMARTAGFDRLGIDLRPLCTHGTNGLAADPACLQVAPDGTFGNAEDLCGLGNGERNICCGIHAPVFVTGRPTPCLTSGDTPVRA